MTKPYTAVKCFAVTVVVGSVALWGCFPAPTGPQGPGKLTTSGESSTPGAPVSRSSQISTIKDTVASLKETARLLIRDGQSLSSAAQKSASTSGNAAFRIMGVATDRYGNVTSWDDVTRQITGFGSPTSEVSISIQGGGSNSRSVEVVVKKSPDGTTGSGGLSISADRWVSFSPAPAPSATPLPYEFAYNQYPDPTRLTGGAARVSIIPQGNPDRRIEASGEASEFSQPTGVFAGFGAPYSCTSGTYGPNGYWIPGSCSTPSPSQGAQLPHLVQVKVSVPRLSFDQTCRWREIGASAAEFSLNGTVTMVTDKMGSQTWAMSNTLYTDRDRMGDSHLKFDWENATQKFRLTGTARPKGSSGSPTGLMVQGQFVSTVDGSELATLHFDSDERDARGYTRNPIITFKDDVLELRADDLLPTPQPYPYGPPYK